MKNLETLSNQELKQINGGILKGCLLVKPPYVVIRPIFEMPVMA